MKTDDNMNWPSACASIAMWLAIGAFLYGMTQCCIAENREIQQTMRAKQ